MLGLTLHSPHKRSMEEPPWARSHPLSAAGWAALPWAPALTVSTHSARWGFARGEPGRAVPPL